MTRYRFIAQARKSYPVRLLCRVLRVSHSGFYDWQQRGEAPTAKQHDDARVTELIRAAHTASRGTYGARRVTAELCADGHQINRKRVARLLRLAGLCGVHRRRVGKRGRPERQAAPAPDLVRREFTAPAPDRLWVADATYLRTWEGWLYLAVVVDAFSRQVVGWSMSDAFTSELVIDAFGMAIHRRQPTQGQLIHHSDRGCQYTSYTFGRRLRESGVLASMGSVADAFDNAPAETFFATLKTELVYRRSWPTRHELEVEVFSYIEGFYNQRRRHSRLDYLSPMQYEARYWSSIPAA